MLEYTESSFIEPETITEAQYIKLKDQIMTNPNFSIIDYEINSFKKFKSLILTCIFFFLLALLSWILESVFSVKSSFIEIIGSIGIFVGVVSLFSYIKSNN